MQRRHILITAGNLTLGGCLLPGDRDEPSESSKRTADPTTKQELSETTGANSNEEMKVDIRNNTDSEKSVSITISHSSTDILKRELNITSNSVETIGSNITERGSYTFSVSTKEIDAQQEMSIEERDLSSDVNLIVDLRSNEIRVLIQE